MRVSCRDNNATLGIGPRPRRHFAFAMPACLHQPDSRFFKKRLPFPYRDELKLSPGITNLTSPAPTKEGCQVHVRTERDIEGAGDVLPLYPRRGFWLRWTVPTPG